MPRYFVGIMTVIQVLFRKLKPGENRSAMAMRCKSIIEVDSLPANLELLLNQHAAIAEKQARMQAEQQEAAQAADNTTATPRKRGRKA